ncbi:hypothetical protein [Fischerella sp. JS2]|uniref:hypothetical protein n=1 Tax=Fischerella sp. JS2 TaxID=2597771 RepID=UPI0028F083B9|nr:hypothetical protein [Fischerella sp. JS2]
MQKISEYRVSIGEIRTKIPFAAASNIYSGYVQMYEQTILKLENEIKSGERFSEELKQLIHEYLLGMELSGIDPIEVINEVDSSRQKNKELDSDLKVRYSSLLRDAEIYLDTIDEYSEIMKSLDNF